MIHLIISGSSGMLEAFPEKPVKNIEDLFGDGDYVFKVFNSGNPVTTSIGSNFEKSLVASIETINGLLLTGKEIERLDDV